MHGAPIQRALASTKQRQLLTYVRNSCHVLFSSSSSYIIMYFSYLIFHYYCYLVTDFISFRA